MIEVQFRKEGSLSNVLCLGYGQVASVPDAAHCRAGFACGGRSLGLSKDKMFGLAGGKNRFLE